MDARLRRTFISYAWGGESERVADALDAALGERGIVVVRDKRDVAYKASIRDFMATIGGGYAVIVIVSDRYLKSRDCMFELTEVARHGDLQDRVFPVVLPDADIHDPLRRIGYVRYWEEQLVALDRAMRSISAVGQQGLREEIDDFSAIRVRIAELTYLLKDMNTLSIRRDEKLQFAVLIERLEERLQRPEATAPAADAVRPAVERVPNGGATAIEKALMRLDTSRAGTAFRRPRLEAACVEHLRADSAKALVVYGLPGIGKTMLVGLALAALADVVEDVVALRLDGPAGVEAEYVADEIRELLLARDGRVPATAPNPGNAERTVAQLLGALVVRDHPPPIVILDGGDFVRGSWSQRLLQLLLAVPRLRIVVAARERTLTPLQSGFVPVPPLDDTEGAAFIDHWSRILGLALDGPSLWKRLAHLPRSNPQSLATWLAQLVDVPLSLLMASTTSDSVDAPARLVEQIIVTLSPTLRRTLAFLALMSRVDLDEATRALGIEAPGDLATALPVLVSRCLVLRIDERLEVPELVGQALVRTDPDATAAWDESLERAWQGALADASPVARLDVLARVTPQIAHNLSSIGRGAAVRRMLDEAFLETLNRRGFWKEYAALVQLAYETARDGHDVAGQFRFGCRLVRKYIQTGESARARTLFAEISALWGDTPGEREQADLHSHRALIAQTDRDEEAVERELDASLRLWRRLDDLQGIAVVEKQIGHQRMRRRDLVGAAASLTSASGAFAALGSTKEHLDAETSLALCELQTGGHELAAARLRTLIEECRRTGFEAGLPRARFHLALAERKCGHLAEAVAQATEAARLARLSGFVAIAEMAAVAAAQMAESAA